MAAGLNALRGSGPKQNRATNPARYFNAAKKGMVRKEFDADLVVLDGDPVADIRNLAKVAYTIRAGEIIYRKP
jgi:imidazolonepropionase-like amidohydrolase